MTSDVMQVRPVPRRLGPQRLRIVGGPRPRAFDRRLVVRCGIAGIPVGALAAILVALAVLRMPAVEALWAYAAGAAAGFVAGLVLGAVLSCLRALVAVLHRSRQARVQKRLWVRHRADGPVTGRR